MDPAAKRERLVKTRPLPENMKRRPLTDARAAAAQKQRQATRAKESALPEVNAAAVVDLAIAVIFWGALYYFWNHTATPVWAVYPVQQFKDVIYGVSLMCLALFAWFLFNIVLEWLGSDPNDSGPNTMHMNY